MKLREEDLRVKTSDVGNSLSESEHNLLKWGSQGDGKVPSLRNAGLPFALTYSGGAEPEAEFDPEREKLGRANRFGCFHISACNFSVMSRVV
jgi:hypothetical protein